MSDTSAMSIMYGVSAATFTRCTPVAYDMGGMSRMRALSAATVVA
jgi:hypothetical protein